MAVKFVPNVDPNVDPKVEPKVDPLAASPALMKTWLRTSMAVASTLDPALVALVEVRASQINGCANCINLHATLAREDGETAQRIYLLSAWREAPCYTARERAALGWTKALTRLCEGHTHEGAYEALKAYFAEAEQVQLTLMINIISGLPGFVTLEADGELQTTALEIEDGKITAIYIVRNPDKLRHLH